MYVMTKAKINQNILSQDSIQGTARMRRNNKSAVNTLRSLTIIMVLLIGIPKALLAACLYGMVHEEKRSIRDGLTLDSNIIKLGFVFANNVVYIRNTVIVFVYFRYIKAFKTFIRTILRRSSGINN